MVVFAVLSIVGAFAVLATFRGYRTFNEIKSVQLPQFQAAETLKQKALDIIGIFYLVAGSSDINIQMEQMYRYDELANAFNANLKSIEDSAPKLGTPERITKVTELTAKTKKIFEVMNHNAREMTLANMAKKPEEGQKFFKLLVADVAGFKKLVDDIDAVVLSDLDDSTKKAQTSLRISTILGVLVTISAIFIALGLIRYLMNFLSVTLLPISNLMHNLRQAVFSINKDLKVISPVSNYSKKVFEKDIVDSNIFDLVFNSLGKKSGAYATVNTALTAVFGEDEMQWSLMEDAFPPLVSMRNQAGAERIVKLTYTPLFQANQTVQDIMIVAEDVTEFEKAKREASAKNAEVLVIQGLVSVDRGDLESFLADTLAGLTQCFDLIGTLETDIESRKLLFRILHTIKGNSRLYNLMTISEVVHVTEQSVVEINTRLDNKDPVESELYAQLTSGLREIEAVVSAHTKTAAQLFGITDASAERREDLLHQTFYMIENTVSRGESVVFDPIQSRSAPLKAQYILSSLKPNLAESIELCSAIAKHFGAQELQEKLDGILAAAKANELKSLDQLKSAREVYFRFFFQSPRKAKYPLDADTFLEPIKKLALLSQCVVARPQSEGFSESEKLRIEQAAYELFNACDAQKNLALRFAVQKFALAVANSWSREEMLGAINNAWRVVGITFHIDSSFNLDPESAKLVSASIDQAIRSPEGTAKIDFELETSPLIVEILQMSEQIGVPLATLARYLTAGLELKEAQELSSFLVGSEGTQAALQEGFLLIKDGLGADSNAENYRKALSQAPSTLIQNQMSIALNSGASRVDLYKVLANYLKDQSLVTEESTQQSYEVSAEWYDKLTGFVEELSGSGAKEIQGTLEGLEDLVASLFDYPLKGLCSKMEPMMRDISKKLGKNINYVVSGDTVALPREVAYALRDALVHMLRNSLDHGIEMPEVRSQRSKADVATIEINCTAQDDQIFILVKDDGAGINTEKVVAKALQMNMISQEQLDQMSSIQRQELIFLSRLSTKDEVSSLSGRGVGMDAVKAIVVDRMKGSIKLESELGKGTVFTIQVPKPKRRKATRGAISEVAAFLLEARMSMQTTLGFVDSMLTNAEAARKMFRSLHTIKESATMHNLKGLADMVHFSENTVSAILQSLDKKEPVEVAAVDKLRSSLKKILEAVEGQLKSHRSEDSSKPKSEVELFIADAHSMMTEAAPFVSQIASDREAGKKLFRILHTLKSNAQMHHLNALADAIHTTEGTVTSINEKVVSGQAVDPTEVKTLEGGMGAVSQALAAAQKKFNKSPTKRGHSEVERFLESAGTEMAEASQCLSSVERDPESGRKLFRILHTLKSNAQMHNLKALADAIHTTEATVTSINEKVAAGRPVDPSEVKTLEGGNAQIVTLISRQLKKVA